MIFIGKGALLKRAVEFTISRELRVDAIFTPGLELANLCRRHAIPLGFIPNVNRDWHRIASQCSDGVLFSINNDQVFRGPPLAQRSIRLFNVHNGLIPAYRGRPEVCLVFALLHREPNYGVTLHEIDAGIDTGPTLDVETFPVTALDDFESVMLQSIDACDAIFRRNVASVVAGRLKPLPRFAEPSRLYQRRDLEQLWRHRESRDLGRATRFGVFQPWFPESWSLIKEQLRQMDGRA